MNGVASVEEVTEFVEGGAILAGVRSPAPAWLVIDDWNAARRFAYSQEAEGQEVWADLREQEAAKLVPVRYRAAEGPRAEFKALSDGYYATPASRLGTTPAARLRMRKAGQASHPAREMIDDIHGDVSNLAEARLLDLELPLFEEVFAAYRAGGWPCGWQGTYPEGQLVVFTPRDRAGPA